MCFVRYLIEITCYIYSRCLSYKKLLIMTQTALNKCLYETFYVCFTKFSSNVYFKLVIFLNLNILIFHQVNFLVSN